jgi:hypothetical protein
MVVQIPAFCVDTHKIKLFSFLSIAVSEPVGEKSKRNLSCQGGWNMLLPHFLATVADPDKQ